MSWSRWLPWFAVGLTIVVWAVPLQMGTYANAVITAEWVICPSLEETVREIDAQFLGWSDAQHRDFFQAVHPHTHPKVARVRAGTLPVPTEAELARLRQPRLPVGALKKTR